MNCAIYSKLNRPFHILLLIFISVFCIDTVYNKLLAKRQPSDSILVDVDKNISTNKKYVSEDAIFDSLAKRTENSWITKTLYKAIVRNQKEMSPLRNPTLVIKPEENFLGYEGRVIREIFFVKTAVNSRSPSDTSLSDIHRLFLQFNSFHVNTHDWRLKQQIHFSKGDEVSSRIIADSERLLRSLHYIKDARIYIEPTFHVDSVDVIVVTQDANFIDLALEMTDVGEYNSTLTLRNILGLGIRARGILYYDEPEENPIGYGIKLANYNIWKTHTNAYYSTLQTDYAKRNHYELYRSFQSSAIKVGGMAEYKNSWSLVQLSEEEVYVPLYSDYYNLWLGTAFDIDGKAFNRLVVSGRVYNQVFDKRPPITPISYYQYHDKLMYLQSFQFRKIRYFNTSLIKTHSLIEDIPFGQTLEFITGYEVATFFERPYVGSKFSIARYNMFRGYTAFQLSGGTYFGDGNIPEQGSVTSDIDYFTRLYSLGSFYYRQFLSLSMTYGFNRFAEESILARETIPGLSSSYLRPFKSKVVLRIEPYFFAPWKPAHFRFAFSPNVDIAYVGEDNTVSNNSALLAGVGFGVNIRNDRLTIQNLSLRFTYYPNTDLYDQHMGGMISTSRPKRYKHIGVNQPAVIPLR